MCSVSRGYVRQAGREEVGRRQEGRKQVCEAGRVAGRRGKRGAVCEEEASAWQAVRCRCVCRCVRCSSEGGVGIKRAWHSMAGKVCSV